MKVATLNKRFFVVDETVLYRKKMPCRPFIAREKSMPIFKGSKKQALLLGVNAAGNFKLKPMPMWDVGSDSMERQQCTFL
jgi:hypothetical protein